MIDRGELARKGGRLVVREGPRRVLVLEAGGRVFALDDRCPHQGYPLSQGAVDGRACALTCDWHNWVFDLATGKCLAGGDNVRTYPVREEGGSVRIDLTEDPAALRAAAMEDLGEAFGKRGYGRMARGVARLALLGADPLDAVRMAVLRSCGRLERGTTHAHAAAADWVALFLGSEGLEDRLICLVEALDHMALDALRRPERPSPKPGPGPWDAEAFLAAVEARDGEAAGSLVAAGLAGGMRYGDAAPVLARAALAHYNDFGHGLIYVVKSGQLAAALDDPAVDGALAAAAARSLCLATREDLLPGFGRLPGAAEDLGSRPPGGAPLAEDVPPGLGVDGALDWLAGRWGDHDPASLHLALLRAAGLNMLRFDLARQDATDNPVSDNVDWLDFTHAVTFANAVRRACGEWGAGLWPAGLAQMACFVGRNRAYLDESVSLDDWDVGDVGSFRARTRARLLDHGEGLPIFSAHLLKTSLAVFEEADRAGPGTTSRILHAALNRFLSSPLKRKRPRRTAHQAIALVSRDFV